jgi:hypothetical protein
MDAGGSKFTWFDIAGMPRRDEERRGAICVVGDGRGNQEHRCHILQRAGVIGQFSSRPKQYPFWGDRSTRQPPAARLIDNAVSGGREKVSSELWSGGKRDQHGLPQSVMRNSSLRGRGPEPLMDKEVGSLERL